MKKISIKQKLILLANYLAALLLLASFINIYLPPKWSSFMSLLSLFFPFIVLINLIFLIYWAIKLKKYIFISGIALLINYNNLQALFQWTGKHPVEAKGFSLMSYNIRLFNTYQWIKKKGIDVDISNYLKDAFPDILLLQEFKNDRHTDFLQYKYKHIVLKGKKRKAGLAIFSRYKIIDKGNLSFPGTFNNAIWADIQIEKDTIRIYNVHFQSFKIVKPENLVNQDKVKVSHKLLKVFDKQYQQALIVQKHLAKSPYPVIISGDFNNTAFSSLYHLLKENKTDAFVEAGEGFGFTWEYKWLPMRIDFILPQTQKFEILSFETFRQIRYSDHFPIQARLKFKKP